MNEIVRIRTLAENVTEYTIANSKIAKKAKPGQFVILRTDADGERVPFTICDMDKTIGTITILVQAVGFTTKKMQNLKEGDTILDFVGPLGNATDLTEFKNILLVGGGIGSAVIFPQMKFLKSVGKSCDVIVGGRNKSFIYYESEMVENCRKLYVMTDDGSYGEKGFVTNKIKELLEGGEKYDCIMAVGPMPMMRAVCDLTRGFGVHTVVSMNSIMLDGTGMCGGCRLTVDGKTKYACVDGPEFDGHLVDWTEAQSRSSYYRDAEKNHLCNLTNASGEVNNSIDKTPRHQQKEQEPSERVKNFDEVTFHYDDETAIAEAKRCINCVNAPCRKGCPVGVNIPTFINCLKSGDIDGAALVIKQDNNLPSICGRVCPQEEQCEKLCVRNRPALGGAVSIGALERYVGDKTINKSNGDRVIVSNGKKVAIIGSGPSGLACAADCAMAGFDVTIYEAFHRAGGVLIYGIPEFRLPKSLVEKEINKLKEYGVKIDLNTVIGKTISMDELRADNEAVFIGTGAGLPVFMGIKGENLNGVFSANELLTRTNLMEAYKKDARTPLKIGKKVAVIGAGNVAMDAARTVKRLGAEDVFIVYRRTKAEMPARHEEVVHAEQEGIKFLELSSPIEVCGTAAVDGIKCVKMALGEPDSSGRRSPIEIVGSEFVFDCDMVIMALGTSPNPLLKRENSGLKFSNRGVILVDNETNMTNIESVYAGGDAVTGAATVILAMGAGKRAAKSIIEKNQ